MTSKNCDLSYHSRSFLLSIGFIALLFIPHHSFGQVGINTTTPDPSSILDIVAIDKGVLLPRVELTSLTDTSTIPSPADGLLVYNTSILNGMEIGFYCWDGTAWQRLAISSEISGSSASTGWGTGGNNTSSQPGSFIGTTNFEDLRFKVNDTTLVTYQSNGGVQMGFGAEADSNNSFAIGLEASATGVEAQSFGPEAEANGYRSVALGYQALASGTESFAIGASAEASFSEAVSLGSSSLASGNASTSIGRNATASGSEATAVGESSTAGGYRSLSLGYQAETGGSAQLSTALGANSSATAQYASAFGSNTTASGQYAVAIGEGAVASQSYSIILGNNLASTVGGSTRVGIGTSTPSAKLHIDGDLRIQDGNEAAGYVLTSDANGNATWQNPSSSGGGAQYAQVYKSSSSNGIQPWAPISFGTNGPANGFNLSNNNIQTQSTTGIYKITYTLNVELISGTHTIEFFVTQGWGSSNKVAGSSTFVNLNSQQTRTTVTKTVYVDVNSGFQQFYVFPDTNTTGVRILSSSSLSIELVESD